MADKKPKKIRKKMSKKARLAIFYIFLALVLSAGTMLGVLYYKQISTKLEMPTFEVFQRSMGTSIVVAENENASFYEFTITRGKETNVVKSKDNILEFEAYLNKVGKADVGEYSVKVRVLGKVAKAHSDYSPVQTFSYYEKLQTPEVQKDGSNIYWNKINGATGYRVYYNVNVAQDMVEYFDIKSNEDVITINIDQKLKPFGAGKYSICVVALGNTSEYRQNSDFSAVVECEYYLYLDELLTASYSQSKNVLTCQLSGNSKTPDRFVLDLTLAKQDLESQPENLKVLVDVGDVKFTPSYVGTELIFIYEIDLNERVEGEISKISISTECDNAYIESSPAQHVEIVS